MVERPRSLSRWTICVLVAAALLPEGGGGATALGRGTFNALDEFSGQPETILRGHPPIVRVQHAVSSLQRRRSQLSWHYNQVVRSCDLLLVEAELADGRLAILQYNDGEAMAEVLAAMHDFGGQAEVLSSACSFISSMSMGRDARVVLARLGAVDLIVAAVKAHPENAVLLERACGALINLAIDRSISAAIGAAGGIRAVLQAVSFATAGLAEVSREKEESVQRLRGVLKFGLAALANLAAVSSNADIIGEEDGISMIIEAVSMAFAEDVEQYAETIMHAAELLQNVASGAQNRQRIVKSGGADLLARIVLRVDATSPEIGPGDIHGASMMLFAKLLADVDTRSAVLDMEADESILPLVFESMELYRSHAKAQESGCRLVSTLCSIAESSSDVFAAQLHTYSQHYSRLSARALEHHGASHEGVAEACRAVCEQLLELRCMPRFRNLGQAGLPVKPLHGDGQRRHGINDVEDPGSGSAVPIILHELAQASFGVQAELACQKLIELVEHEAGAMAAFNALHPLMRWCECRKPLDSRFDALSPNRTKW